MALIAVHAVVHISPNALVVLIRFGFRVAIGALENRVVVRIRMARRAHAVGVAMVDRKRSVLRVIERRILPVRGVVAVLARRREKLRLGRVPRIRGVVVIALMAADAGRRQRGVVIVDVAVGAGPRGHRVRSRQWKGRVVVIESRIRPGNRVMAKLASRREAGMRHRTVRSVEIGLVARNAERAVQGVVVVHVAVGAGARGDCMRSRQWEPGLRMIELAIGPLDCVMAVLASRREAGVRHRTFRVVVVVLVATDTGGRQRGVVVVDVAVSACSRGHRMRSGQGKRRVVVIECRVRPGGRVVAHLASRREAGVRHRTIRSVEILLVACNAQRAVQSVVVVDVAIRARPWRDRMRTSQWEAGLRVIELGIRPLHGVMTLLASRRETRVRHRASRVVEILLMARNAGRVRDVVVGGAMAVRARPWGHGVRTGQGERGFGVVKRCRLPR